MLPYSYDTKYLYIDVSYICALSRRKTVSEVPASVLVMHALGMPTAPSGGANNKADIFIFCVDIVLRKV